MLTDVEVSRVLNALATTLRDQRPAGFDAVRIEQIVTGALAQERKLRAQQTGPASGELRIRKDDRLVAVVELRDGQWNVERKLHAADSSWALPQPTDDEQQAGEQTARGR